MRLVDTLPVRRTPRAGGEAATTVKQPVELASMSKFRERTVYDRRNLKPLAVPALPVDLNHGFERFVDRDRNNAYPAPLNTITGALASAGHEEELSKANFVTWRGNLAKLLVTPFNKQDSWHMELECVGDTIYLNVKEPAENLATEAQRDARMTRMCFWGFSFEQHVTGEPLDSTKPIDTMESFCVVMRTALGRHEIVLGAEVDCCAAGTDPTVAHGAKYIELKTTRLMDKPMQVMRFERDKLVKWWAQSFPAGVQDIVVGFRDDRGFVRSVQTYKTLQLPRFVAGKPHAWDAKLSLAFAVEVLDWVQRHLFAFRDEQRAKAEATKAQQEEAGGGAQVVQRFRMEYSPRVTGDSIRLFHDPSIPDFFARGDAKAAGAAEEAGGKDVWVSGGGAGGVPSSSSVAAREEVVPTAMAGVPPPSGSGVDEHETEAAEESGAQKRARDEEEELSLARQQQRARLADHELADDILAGPVGGSRKQKPPSKR